MSGECLDEVLKVFGKFSLVLTNTANVCFYLNYACRHPAFKYVFLGYKFQKKSFTVIQFVRVFPEMNILRSWEETKFTQYVCWIVC